MLLTAVLGPPEASGGPETLGGVAKKNFARKIAVIHEFQLYFSKKKKMSISSYNFHSIFDLSARRESKMVKIIAGHRQFLFLPSRNIWREGERW